MAEADVAREVAECGFLAHVAVTQMQRRGELSPTYDALRRETVGFALLWHEMEGHARDAPGIDAAMLAEVTAAGRAVHARRITGMGRESALRTANSVLAECRAKIRIAK